MASYSPALFFLASSAATSLVTATISHPRACDLELLRGSGGAVRTRRSLPLLSDSGRPPGLAGIGSIADKCRGPAPVLASTHVAPEWWSPSTSSLHRAASGQRVLSSLLNNGEMGQSSQSAQPTSTQSAPIAFQGQRGQ